MNFLWFLPTSGDTRYLGTTKGGRPADYGYFRQVAQAADRLGYTGILVPTGNFCEDPFVLASSLAVETERLKFLVAVRPGVTSPTYAARQASTLDRVSNGRLMINVVAGGDPVELRGDGIFLNHDERYEETDEFLTIWKGLLSGEAVNFKGKHLQVEDGRVLFSPVQQPYPPVYFSGSSPKGHEVAAKHSDLYITWGEPPADVAKKIKDVRERAEKEGRSVRFGIRLHVIVRETEQEAWDAANKLISRLDEETIEAARQGRERMDSVGQKLMNELHHFDKNASLEISPNLWAGVGLVRGGCGTALVGNPNQVAARIKEYADLGIDTFVLSGYPHLEEAYRTAELLFPLLPFEANSTNGKQELVGSVYGNGYKAFSLI